MDGKTRSPKVVVTSAYNAGRAEVPVPTRYLPEASSASFPQSAEYGIRILFLLARYALHRTRLVRFRQFECLGARYRRLA